MKRIEQREWTPLLWECDDDDEIRVGGGGGTRDVGLVNVWRKFDDVKFGRKREERELLPLDGVEKYVERSNDGRNCWVNAWRRKSASNAVNVDVGDGTKSD